MRAISYTYFPEFEELVQQLENTSYTYENWMLGAKRKRVMNEPNVTAGHEEIVKIYMEKRQELLTELKNFARREFQ